MINRQAMKDRLWLQVAANIATLGTCARRQVGCVLLDFKGRIAATGYNGVAPNVPHCIDTPCRGADLPSGSGLDQCEAIHAEQNALTQCKFPDEIRTVYLTTSPCMHCVKMLATTGAVRIVFSEGYPHSEAAEYWRGLGRSWEYIQLPEQEPCLRDRKAQHPCPACSCHPSD